MKPIITLFINCFILINITVAQSLSPEYSQLVKKAEALYNAKDYKASAMIYADAFKANGWKATIDDRYNAACSWALSGNADSAFYHLERIAAKMEYSDYQHITHDSDLNSLHNDSRWASMLAIVQKNKDKAEANLNKPLVHQLEEILTDDQEYRGKVDSVRKKYGLQSPEFKTLVKTINAKDSVNLIKVKAILDQYGWPGADIVGNSGALTVFLVIQHADLATQQHYLPALREAVRNKKARAANLALLEDRVAMREGRKQIYGSQLQTDPKTGKTAFYSIEDEPNVNKRRASVGLEPLEDYAKRFGLEYKLPSQ
jgi:hypothetical protein